MRNKNPCLKILPLENQTLASDPAPTQGARECASRDFKKRELDCAVIRFTHQLAEKKGTYFDSVRAAFLEGEPLYPGSMFRKQNHIQIAVINPNCIKGIFLPREEVPFPSDNFPN